ncbi:ECF RNA polymerase sigma factor SigK [Nocardia iowensis]|uniref:ECF RNA polymerase sigma factor SigK n=1 Tax=Nocardia iowensis TaxID=204891 RepID=A0ABX8S4A2_NOCIO|nr:ECF RNA polymerase sigma factor SigK [Nocardia iowensis]
MGPPTTHRDFFNREGFAPSTDGEVTARCTESAELATLLEQCGQSNPQAFAEFYDRTCARVFGLVLRVVCDRGYAEDITQEVYLQVWRTAAGFDPGKGSALTWLMMLAHRRAVDRVRTERACLQREFDYGIRVLGREFDEVAEQVEHQLEQQAVLAGLASLTLVQRQAITLAYYDGRTYAEVAHYLGIGLPTVKSRIRQGLIRLKTRLADA